MTRISKTAGFIIVVLAAAAISFAIYSGRIERSNLAARLASCRAFPNNSTQHVVDTARLFITIPKDMYPDRDISPNFETASGNATAGYISNGGPPGESLGALPGCWSTYFEFDGTGEVDLKIKSTQKDVPDYFVRFVVGPTQ